MLQLINWKTFIYMLIITNVSNGSVVQYKNSSNTSSISMLEYFHGDLDHPDQCHKINLISKEERCQFAEEFCSSENLGFFNYLNRYYCSSSSIESFGILSLNAIRLIALFTILGIAASDYLSPNLNTSAKLLHIGENLAGLTLLAFGNGSPDLISTFIAMKANSAQLAISELIGAALFITSMVVGLMCIVHPFKVFKSIYMRDTMYFLMSTIAVSYFILIKQAITLSSCLIFLGIYLLYVLVILIWQLFINRQHKRQYHDRKARGEFFDDPGNSMSYQDTTDPSIPSQDPAGFSIGELDEVSENNRDIEAILGEDSEYSSLSLSFNPFSDNPDGESSGIQDDGLSNKSYRSSSSRVLSTADSGYITYQDIVAPGMVESNDDFIYNIHEENEEFDGDEDQIVNNQFLVRPSIIDALQLGSNNKLKKKLDTSNRSNTNQILINDDNISLHTISRTLTNGSSASRDEDDNKRPSGFLFLLLNFFNKFKKNSISLDNGNFQGGEQEEDEEIRNYNNVTETAAHNDNEGEPIAKADVENLCATPKSLQNSVKNKYFKAIFPMLLNFNSKPTLDKILTVIVLPLSVALRLTTASIEFSNIKKLNESIKKLKTIRKIADVVSNGNDENGNLESQNLTIDERPIPENLLFCGRTYEELKVEGAILLIQLFCGPAILIVLAAIKFKIPSLIIFTAVFFSTSLTLAFNGIIEPDILAAFKELENSLTLSLRIKYLLRFLRAKKVVYYYASTLGFLMCLVWISYLASEVVSILKFYSVVFNLSDEILGFTVFAVGNSLGDLIANFVIAKMGFPRMALAACFGGPLLNILLGVGVGGYFVLPDSESSITINSGLTLWVSCISLILNLLFLAVAVPNNNWKMNSHIGYVCICFWITATVINVIFEILK